MGDVGVTLDDHEFVRAHRPILAHAAQVVPFQVHQHQMFGPLFGVGDQVFREAAVFGGGMAARARAGDRARIHPAAVQPHQPFGRRTHQRHALEGQEAAKGRGVHLAHAAVERRAGMFTEMLHRPARVAVDRQAMREVGLVDVAGADEVLALFGALDIIGARLIGLHGQVADAEIAVVFLAPRQQLRVQLGQAVASFAIELLAGLAQGLVERGRVDQVQRPQLVIHGGEEIHEGEDQIGQTQIVCREIGQLLELPDQIVAEKSDGAADERRGVIRPGNPRGPDQFGESLEGVALMDGGPVAGAEFVAHALAGQFQIGIAAEERPARHSAAAFAAFEQERGASWRGDAAVQLEDVGLGLGHREHQRLRLRRHEEACPRGTDHFQHGIVLPQDRRFCLSRKGSVGFARVNTERRAEHHE